MDPSSPTNPTPPPRGREDPTSASIPPSSPLTTRPGIPAPARFNPGDVLAGRYRIVALLGKGGMGEVYRADDLSLGVSVAIKFLPEQFAADPLRVERFRAEVRLARQISNANVCRVYDIGEADGVVFLSMEYVDGEDLGSLLRRIGRLPEDKAVQIARQICFGLAAAHEQGVIHRDLKPANIMLDGRGNARIMDFGIAGIASDLMATGDVSAGTPAYMAPEQLAGKEVSKQSDIYSLGLVLYELFTGKQAFTAKSVAEIRAVHESASRPENLTSHVGALDPAIERVVLRCLETDPADRPSSAVAVAAALPGGDPLAAALAAGETPSPELVAASGAAQLMSPAQAWGRAALIALIFAGFVALTAPWTLVSRVKPAKTNEVLQDRALEVLHAIGYTHAPADSVCGLNARDPFITRINVNTEIKNKVERLLGRPGAYEFWYRQSPTTIEAVDRDGMVRQTSPFPSRPGEVLMRSDSAGRLESLAVIPARKRSGDTTEAPEATIKRLFEFADFDQSRFTPAEPIYRPFVSVDSMRSWTGTLAEQPELAIRVHVGQVEGKVVYFGVAYPWTVASFDARTQPPAPKSFVEYLSGAVLALVMIATCRLVWKNLRTARGDRTSAFRVAVAMFFFALCNLLVVQHHLPSARDILAAGGGLSAAAFAAVEFWFFYIAVEPYARRVYPQALVSWTRVLRGTINDPLVGRHLLVGLLLGAVSVLCTGLFATAFNLWARPIPAIALYGRSAGYLGGWQVILFLTADVFVTALMLGAGSMLTVVMGQLVFKRRWAGFVMLVVALAALDASTLLANPIEGAISIAIAMIPVFSIRSGGLLALVTTHAVIFLGQMLPVGLDWSHWFAMPVLIPAGLLSAVTIIAARAASAGRTLVA